MEAVIIDGKQLALTHEAPFRLAARSDELSRLVTLVNELADFRRVGWLETIGRGHPVIGDVSATPVGKDVELRWPAQTLVIPVSAIEAALRAIATARAPTSRHLFTDAPVAPVPHPEVEEPSLRDLDAQLAELDRMEAAGDEAATGAKRRFVFDDLDFFGILTLSGHEARTFWLERWGLAHVLEFQRAALAAWTYYLGQQRVDLDNPFMPKRLLDGPFSSTGFAAPRCRRLRGPSSGSRSRARRHSGVGSRRPMRPPARISSTRAGSAASTGSGPTSDHGRASIARTSRSGRQLRFPAAARRD